MKSRLEALVVSIEIRLGFLLVPIAESAYNVRDVGRGDEARGRGQAAYFRANRLLAQVAECDRKPLADDLESLQIALDGLFKDQQSAFTGAIRDQAHPEQHSVLPPEKTAKKSLDADDPVDLETQNPAVRRA